MNYTEEIKKTINIFFQLNFEYDLLSKVLRIIKENSIIIQNQKLEIKTKILERSGFDEVLHMDSHSGDMYGYNSSSADMNSIKENLEMRSKR